MPGLKVRCLDRADTEQDAQHFQIGDSLGQRWIEATATYLDEPKMEASRVGYCLDVFMGSEVGIGSGNRWKLPFTQTWDGLREGVTKIAILRAAAVPSPP